MNDYKPEELNAHCPFCFEQDFDLIGLKYHLFNHCEEIDEIPNLNRKSTWELINQE